MRAILLGLTVSMTMVAGAAEARDGCGRGYYYNGYRCVPQGYAPPPRYAPPFRFAPAYVDQHGQQTYYPGPGRSCPPRYTVQSGVCKPYRGY